MEIQRRLISRIAITDGAQVTSVDVSALLHRLILFDTCILGSIRLQEIPFLISAFGFDGFLQLLSAGALEIYAGLFTIAGGVTQGGIRTTPNYCFDFGTVDIAFPEKHTHNCLASFHDIQDLSHKQIVRLKREVASRLVELEEGVGAGILEQLKRDIRTNSPTIRSAIKLRLQELHLGTEIILVQINSAVLSVAGKKKAESL